MFFINRSSRRCLLDLECKFRPVFQYSGVSSIWKSGMPKIKSEVNRLNQFWIQSIFDKIQTLYPLHSAEFSFSFSIYNVMTWPKIRVINDFLKTCLELGNFNPLVNDLDLEMKFCSYRSSLMQKLWDLINKGLEWLSAIYKKWKHVIRTISIT